MDDRRRALLQALEHHLHALCQPLTALQCLLELGQMSGDREGLREAVVAGMEETRRIFAAVERIRDCLIVENAAEKEQVPERDAGQPSEVYPAVRERPQGA